MMSMIKNLISGRCFNIRATFVFGFHFSAELIITLYVNSPLSGTARTEKESSSVADADLPSNLLPLSEKVTNPC